MGEESKGPAWSEGLSPKGLAGQVVALVDFSPAWEAFSRALAEGGELARAFEEVAPALIEHRAHAHGGVGRDCFLDFGSKRREQALRSLSMMAQANPEVARALAPRWDPDEDWWREAEEEGSWEGELVWEVADAALGCADASILERFQAARAFEGLWRSKDWMAQWSWGAPNQAALAEAALGGSWSGPAELDQGVWRFCLRSPALIQKALALAGPELAASLRLSTVFRAAADGEGASQVGQSVLMLLETGAFNIAEVAKLAKSKEGRSAAAPIVAAFEHWLLERQSAPAPTRKPKIGL